jgi:FkbM family methyltransferase
MKTWTFDELHTENARIASGLQYTIAERDRLNALWKMVGAMVNVDTADTVAAIMQALLETPSERFQEIFALLLSGGKTGGFFVEFGACDGLCASNTLMLERKFGWKGILGEPGTFWHERLKNNRKASIDTRCVSSKTGEKLKFFQSTMPGNSSTQSDHPYLGTVADSYEVDTVSLLDLLRDHKAPKFIDFISIDTEGHEKPVLDAFDFDQYKFGMICVEQHSDLSPDDDVQPLLEAAGYKVIFPRTPGALIHMQITGVDKFFIPATRDWSY